MELLKLLLRNTLRHKLRSLLTIIGVGVAVMAFALLQTVVTAWYAGVEASAANRLITRHAVSFVFPLPLAYRDRNACIIGIDIAERYNLKLGDIMLIEGDVYPGQWDFVVRGIYYPRDQTTDPSSMMFHYK